MEGHNESAGAGAHASAGLGFNLGQLEAVKAEGIYTVECRDAEGNLKWTDTIENLVTTPGKNFILDTVMAGSAYTAAWYLLLMSSASYTTGANVADTMASHGGWTESTAYSNTTRVAATFGNAASGGSKPTSAASVFNINATDTIKGCGLVTNSTKGGTTGTLYSIGLFTGGDKGVASGDTLSVSYTPTIN